MVLALAGRVLREGGWFAAILYVCAALGRASIAADGDSYSATERSHWSLQPRRSVKPPVIRELSAPGFVRGPIDAFVLERLIKAGLKPAGEAEPRVLVRRLTFNLLGLPPTAVETEAFVADRAPDAYERLVDRLLADPHYGEAWAQHWLDVVLYEIGR